MHQSQIRNFCIIAHIDHGKSTLADRLLELTGTVEKRKMRDQLLDQMDLERERGITIKLAPARMRYSQSHGANRQSFDLRFAISDLQDSEYILNLIDTPGHVDFTYEVSRSLAAVEGVLLLVDVTQGVQAQTIGNLHLAQELGLVIIPVMNKVDVAGADIPTRRKELAELLHILPDDVLLASGKTGEGVPEILEAIVSRIPSPRGVSHAPLRALIFDSVYDDYKGVIAYVRIVDGAVCANQKIRFMGTGHESESLEVGILTPVRARCEELGTGEIGYIVTGLKDIGGVRVGDTITTVIARGEATKQSQEIAAGRGAAGAMTLVPLPGYKELPPMVYAGIFPTEGIAAEKLREALLKLKLNDAALAFEPERSTALGLGFRIGLLGMLHLEIVKERLRREHGIELVVTVPSVAYRVYLRDGSSKTVKSALELPDPSYLERVEEPYVRADIVTPKQYLGQVMQLAEEKRGTYLTTDYLEDRAIVHYELPLTSIIVDFYDKLKSVGSGYGSFHYELIGYRPADVVRMDILVAEEPVEAFSTLAYREEAGRVGRKILESLKESIPRGQFEIKLQARVGGKILAAERIPPVRKDVLAKMSGGDVTRKMKLLKKQKQGKKAMMARGRGSVEIPPEAYLAVLKR
ncbi:elongation factor 4 [Candidatus Uhrbacteria bacterium]|nr:elongation factor 4 [Candidatus Uhrbacteria bacterium]